MKNYLATVFMAIVWLYQIQTAHGQEFSVINTTFKGGSTGSVTNSARVLNYVNNTATLGKYGGTTDVQLTATGHFRTELYNDHWYMVDPEGYLYFGIGVNSVSFSSNYPGVTLPTDLKSPGFNHLANWSEFEDINSGIGTEKIPYVFRELFLQGYKNESQTNKDLWSDGIIAIFDSGFVTYADEAAQRVAVNKDDPYCIGVFSDNEMPIYSNSGFGDLLARFLAIADKTNPNYIAANDWMIARKGVGYTIDSEDDEAFHGYVSSTYYRIVHDAIEKYAPNMLYIGARIHGAAKFVNAIYKDSAPYVDVFSVNWYSGSGPDTAVLEMWTEESGKPFIISEFYAKAYDVGLANDQGAGYNVPTQADRAIYFENFAINLLESKGCLGYQWFRFQDDSSNKGVINANDEWYIELKNSLTKVNKDIYNLRSFLAQEDVVVVEDNIVPVLEDSFVRGTGPQGNYADTNYDGERLIVKESPTDAAFSRRTYMKFDVSEFSSITSATLNFSGNQSSGSVFTISIHSIDDVDDTWSESNLTWKNAPSIPNTVITTFNTNGDIGGSTDYDLYAIDLTSHIQEEVSSGNKIVSIVFTDAALTNEQFRIYHKEGATDVSNNIITANLSINGELLSLENNVKPQFLMYPNPLMTNKVLTLNSPSSIKSISIFNIHGAVVQKINDVNSNVYTLDASTLKNSGIYLVQVETVNGFIETNKLIVE